MRLRLLAAVLAILVAIDAYLDRPTNAEVEAALRASAVSVTTTVPMSVQLKKAKYKFRTLTATGEALPSKSKDRLTMTFLLPQSAAAFAAGDRISLVLSGNSDEAGQENRTVTVGDAASASQADFIELKQRDEGILAAGKKDTIAGFKSRAMYVPIKGDREFARLTVRLSKGQTAEVPVYPSDADDDDFRAGVADLDPTG